MKTRYPSGKVPQKRPFSDISQAPEHKRDPTETSKAFRDYDVIVRKQGFPLGAIWSHFILRTSSCKVGSVCLYGVDKLRGSKPSL